MPSTVSTIICVCWWVVLGVITAPSFVQVTVVAGPPVEVQLRVLDSLSNVSSETLGAPACKQGQDATCKLNDSILDVEKYRNIDMVCHEN